jgi:LacI family transcriptional regulator
MSIKEIARRTGLSVPTVGNVLGRAANRYSAETRSRVLAAAAEIGYRPNSSARAMRRGRIGCAALVLSRSRQNTLSAIPSGLLDGLDDELAKHNMHLAVSRLSDEELSSDIALPKVLREYMADGMIVNYTHEIPPKMLEQIHAHHTPAVWINAKLDADCVYAADYEAARTVTQHLISLGHRRIGFLHMISASVFQGDFESSKPRMHYSTADRARGYSEVMIEAGLQPRVATHDRFVDDEEHMRICSSLLSGADRVTAMLVYSEGDVALALMAATSLGLEVPRDLSIIAFAAYEPRVAGRYMSIIRLPTSEVGRRAVRMLLKKVEHPDDLLPPDAVEYDGITGPTIAAPAVATAKSSSSSRRKNHR